MRGDDVSEGFAVFVGLVFGIVLVVTIVVLVHNSEWGKQVRECRESGGQMVDFKGEYICVHKPEDK